MDVHEELEQLMNKILTKLAQSLGMNLRDLVNDILIRILPHIPKLDEDFLHILDNVMSFGYSVKASVDKFVKTINADGYEVVEFEVDILKPEIRMLLIPKDDVPIDFLEIVRLCEGWSLNAKYYLEWLEGASLTDEELEHVNRVIERTYEDKSMYIKLDQVLGGYRITLNYYSDKIPPLDTIARIMKDVEELIRKILRRSDS